MIVSIILFILLGIVVFILLIPKASIERFQLEDSTSLTSRSLYQQSNNYESDLPSLFPTLADNDDMLIMAACYQLPPNNRSMIPEDCFRETATLYTASFEEVRAKILAMLIDIKGRNKNNKLKDPAFVLLEQAPYMRDDKDNVISMQYSTRAYLFQPVNLMKEGASAADLDRPLYIRVTLFLTNYLKSMTMRQKPSDLRMALLPYRSKKDQCFISCIGDSNTFCGCMNRDVVSSDNKSYASKCSSTPLASNGQYDLTKNVEADFAVLYSINTRSTTIVSSDVFQ